MKVEKSKKNTESNTNDIEDFSKSMAVRNLSKKFETALLNNVNTEIERLKNEIYLE